MVTGRIVSPSKSSRPATALNSPDPKSTLILIKPGCQKREPQRIAWSPPGLTLHVIYAQERYAPKDRARID